MIKRSAILLLLLAIGSISLLVFSSYKSVAATTPINNDAPVKCSGPCKKAGPPLQWNIISQTMFQSES